MSEALPLHRLLAEAVPDGLPVAWRDGGWVTRRQFVAEAAAWRAAFTAAPGRRHALYFEDSLSFAAALFGAWHAGVEVCLPGDRQPATLERLRALGCGFAGDLPGALQPAATCTPPVFTPLDPRAARLLVFTSGSSGEPAAIPKRLDQLDAEVQALQSAFSAALDAGGPAWVAATVSHQHIYGLLFQVLWPLAAARPFCARRLEYAEEITTLPGTGPLLLVSSPAHLRRLPPAFDWAAARQRLRAVTSSGGPLPVEAAEQSLALLGQSPTEVFGSSETGGIAWRRRAEHGERWQPLPGVDWRIDDERLAVRSRHLPDDAWWPTSDRVQALADGAFELLGRADRIVKVEGKRISLTAIEQALLADGTLAEARALLLPAALGGRLAVVTVPGPAARERLRQLGRRAFNEQLRRALLATLERVALPRRWRHVTTLPADTQGKCSEAALAALFRPLMPEPVWLERGPERARLVLPLDPTLRVFDGHFPGAPILPGVAQIDWAATFGRQCFELPPRFLRLEQLKFQRPLEPGMRAELLLECRAGTGVLLFRYESEQGVHAGGRIVFGEADA
ncbi:hypothetical protein CKO44_01410 [Rubrivivax gelatinosus]|uniref:AMP-binding protein n=1 Tax=Rubrivivax gelatinosus TaxID=28068 RepID=UPI00190876EB|nr:AMP-binding protein [Rubrivivax gelatinosus]MBK1612126.1 hypothetical protein [Rubrivivax gelatinosus]